MEDCDARRIEAHRRNGSGSTVVLLFSALGMEAAMNYADLARVLGSRGFRDGGGVKGILCEVVERERYWLRYRVAVESRGGQGSAASATEEGRGGVTLLVPIVWARLGIVGRLCFWALGPWLKEATPYFPMFEEGSLALAARRAEHEAKLRARAASIRWHAKNQGLVGPTAPATFELADLSLNIGASLVSAASLIAIANDLTLKAGLGLWAGFTLQAIFNMYIIVIGDWWWSSELGGVERQ